jgi:hypothetical protein
MKTILIDEFIKDLPALESVSVVIDGKRLSGWMISKPLNYEKRYTTLKERFIMAKKVLVGKSTAMQFFSDLTKEEKIVYVKTKF